LFFPNFANSFKDGLSPALERLQNTANGMPTSRLRRGKPSNDEIVGWESKEEVCEAKAPAQPQGQHILSVILRRQCSVEISIKKKKKRAGIKG